MGVLRQPRRPNARPAMPICPNACPAIAIPRQRQREMLSDDDPYGMPAGPRYIARPPPPPMQHRLVKLDVFKGELGEKLDDFLYQVVV